MTTKEILEIAIKKAIAEGYSGTYESVWINIGRFSDTLELIYNHDFAKALWGEKLTNPIHIYENGNMAKVQQTAWQYHLQRMVIADNPIQYLKDNI